MSLQQDQCKWMLYSENELGGLKDLYLQCMIYDYNHKKKLNLQSISEYIKGAQYHENSWKIQVKG